MFEVHVIPVSWQSHGAALTKIRHSVFVEEQNIPADTEFDSEDAEARHLLALDSAGTALGCARLLASGLIGRVAVVSDQRGKGLGKLLIKTTVKLAQDNGITRVFLHAQENALRFYQKLEFVPTGVKFMEAGIPHVSMERALPIPFDTAGLTKSTIVRSETKSVHRDTLARTSELREFANEEAALEQLHQVIASARRSLWVYSPTLDHRLFDGERTVELVSNLARSAQGVQINLLINNSALIVERGHMLIELGRRLEQKMAVRKLPDTVKADAQSWLVVDHTGLWVQSEPEDYQGWSCLLYTSPSPRDRTRSRMPSSA